MITIGKVIEFFCGADGFCREYSLIVQKNQLEAKCGRKWRNCPSLLSYGEIGVILVCFHFGKSTMSWFCGFKLHLICNDKGDRLNFCLTKANVDDRNPEVFKRVIREAL